MNEEIDNIIMGSIIENDEKFESITDIVLNSIDEVFMMIEPLIAINEEILMSLDSPEPLNEIINKEVSKMVELYVVMIQRGLKTIDQVPTRYREQVRELLEQVK